jgi:hypothetical protein
MEVINQKKSELSVILDDIIFSDLVLSGLGNKDESAKKVLEMTKKAKILLSEIGTLLQDINIQQKTTKSMKIHSENDEINKVESRLKKWSTPQAQHHINSRILNAFLEFRRSGNTHITREDLQNKLPDINTFYGNFNQMKASGKQTHGKIFTEIRNIIEIWNPVKKFVDEYEKIVFKR